MARFNLICNGMMLFREVNSSWVEIIIPTIPGHVRKICTKEVPAKSNLDDLAIGQYDLQGVAPVPASLRQLINPRQYLVLKRDGVVYNEAAAIAVSAIITVPMPDLVRLFRASEPKASVFGGTPQSVAFEKPRIHHDIVAFCYTNVQPGTITLQLQAGNATATAPVVADDIISWVLYSTDEDPLLPHDLPHDTAINNLLQVGGVNTEFSLSAIGFKDGPHKTGVGVSMYAMAAFHELPQNPQGEVADLNCGDFGCSGVVLAG